MFVKFVLRTFAVILVRRSHDSRWLQRLVEEIISCINKSCLEDYLVQNGIKFS